MEYIWKGAELTANPSQEGLDDDFVDVHFPVGCKWWFQGGVALQG